MKYFISFVKNPQILAKYIMILNDKLITWKTNDQDDGQA